MHFEFDDGLFCFVGSMEMAKYELKKKQSSLVRGYGWL
ncbi:hypothetical protein BN997_01484 [Oceanobacillus oncorhynchi]|uniref:Uncharacterized protein n=1 Tax=Oceanobacillus oncorhynchi TaxID=545501 RepID=A0A0A1MPG0_9BACI|nr:hypothetical protein BN997_01484 [Oceanobacillus oncorhynchi]